MGGGGGCRVGEGLAWLRRKEEVGGGSEGGRNPRKRVIGKNVFGRKKHGAVRVFGVGGWCVTRF